MHKEKLVEYVDGGLDHDTLQERIEEVVEKLDFLAEWGSQRETRIHLDQGTGEIVHYLVENCDENPRWIKPELHHVPPETWEEYGI